MKLSLSWFKSKKEQKALPQSTNVPVAPQEQESTVKHFTSLKLIADVLTVVFNDGSVLSKPDCSVEQFNKVRNCQSEDEIFSIIASPEVIADKQKLQSEYDRMANIQKGIHLMEITGDFEVRDNAVYLKMESISHRSLPDLLVEEFAQIVGNHTKGHTEQEIPEIVKADDAYQGLKNFFMWCCLSPRAEVSEKLYGFLKKNAFRITRQGFFAALRNVVSLSSEGNQKVEFISNAYNKIRSVWKKDPAKYEVYELDGEFCFHKSPQNPSEYPGNWIGNLKELYLELPDMVENRFTDDYSHSFDIRIGKEVNMPVEQCRWNTDDCGASGLHFTSDEIHYVGCGDTSVLVLINPMKVVGIGTSKGRSYEYLPIMTVPREEATQLLHDLDFDTLTLDEDYAIRELENLEQVAQKGFTAESCKHEFNLPQMSSEELQSLVTSLSQMKTIISKRVSEII